MAGGVYNVLMDSESLFAVDLGVLELRTLVPEISGVTGFVRVIVDSVERDPVERDSVKGDFVVSDIDVRGWMLALLPRLSIRDSRLACVKD